MSNVGGSFCSDNKFYDPVRGQCIGCATVCPENAVPDRFCENKCPRIQVTLSPNVSSTMVTAIVVTTVTTILIILLIVAIVFILRWKKRTKQGPTSSELGTVDQMKEFTAQSTTNDANTGGCPEENPDPATAKLLPTETDIIVNYCQNLRPFQNSSGQVRVL